MKTTLLIIVYGFAMLVSGCATSHSTSLNSAPLAYPRDAVTISVEADGIFYLSDIVTLRSDGNAFQRGQHLDLATLSVKLKELGAQHPNLYVSIAIPKDTKQRYVTAVTKECKNAGLKEIGYSPVWEPEAKGTPKS